MSKTRQKALPGGRNAAFSRLEIRLLGAAVVTAAAASLVLSVVVDTQSPDEVAGLSAAQSAAAADR